MMEQQDRYHNPMIVSVEMGYGHLRAAYTLAELFGSEVIRMDLPPQAGPVELRIWRAAQVIYNGLSRASNLPAIGPVARPILESITGIAPLQNHGYTEPANLTTRFATRFAEYLADTLIGRRFCLNMLGAQKPVFIATYPVAALAAKCVPGARVYCLATDTDLSRAWAPANASGSDIECA
jgi:hypothetical protein